MHLIVYSEERTCPLETVAV